MGEVVRTWTQYFTVSKILDNGKGMFHTCWPRPYLVAGFHVNSWSVSTHWAIVGMLPVKAMAQETKRLDAAMTVRTEGRNAGG